jgi:hypothetical protein
MLHRPWDEAYSVEGIRANIQKLSDKDLLRYGRAARYMVSPAANYGKPPRKVFQVQLDECRAERKRRHACR